MTEFFQNAQRVIVIFKQNYQLMNSLTKLCFILIMFPLITNAQFISSDDKLHLGAGAIISSATYIVVYNKTENKSKAFWYSLGVSALAGLGKELYDSTKKGNKFDTGELVATTAGGFVASITFDLFTKPKKRKKRN